jgi:hypothetical protein
MRIAISTKGVDRTYDAVNAIEAVQMFFDDIRDRKIGVDDLGLIGEWSNGALTVPFRIAPSVYRLGLITESQAIDAHERAGLPIDATVLKVIADMDSWMIREYDDEESDGVLDAEFIG